MNRRTARYVMDCPNMLTRSSWRRSLFLLYAVAFLYLLYCFSCLLIQGWNLQPGVQSCQPKLKVAFLKTHKCASSTVQNILFRFGANRNLNFVFPPTSNYLGRNMPFHRSMVDNLPWHKFGYNIFALHTIWNQREVEALMGTNTSFVSILRNPVDLFESLYSYADLDTIFGMDINMFTKVSNITAISDLRSYGYLGRNQMLFDFGLDPADMTDLQKVKKKIREIDSNFNLIMIAEHFDESLVLLKDLLCWDFRDVVSLKINARKDQFKQEMLLETRLMLQEWLWADQLLYNHFLQKFNSKREEYGEVRLAADVIHLQKLNAEASERCKVLEMNNENLTGVFKTWSKRVAGYKVKEDNSECRDLGMSELAFIDRLRNRQLAKSGPISNGFYFPVNPFSEDVDKSNLTAVVEVLKKVYIHNQPFLNPEYKNSRPS